jgi:hypothetical protein
MGVLDPMAEQYGALVQNVMALDSALQNRYEHPPSLAALGRMGYASQHIDATYATDTPPAGIFGAGAINFNDQMRPAIFMLLDLMSAPVEMPSGPSSAATPGQQLVSMLIPGLSPPADLAIVGLPRIRNFDNPRIGSTITVHTEQCALGVSVLLADGRRGYLTAGHGARNINDSVLLADSRIGEVVFSSCRELAPPSLPTADVAAIALDQAIVEEPTGWPPITRAAEPTPPSLVSVRRSGPLRRGRVWGVAPSFATDSYAPWGEVLLCSPMSVPGDSGSAVVCDEDTCACIGHVVGGVENYITIVQQLGYHLDSVKANLRG